MATEKLGAARPAPAPTPGTLLFPTNSTEFVAAFAHYYRGELARMMSWRERLDLTTNWSIGAVAAMLSISLSSPDSHHAVLVFAMLIVYMLLTIEARRYRFFDVYRTRVRVLERLYYAPIFDPQGSIDPTPWLSGLGQDLRSPRFSLSLAQAMSRRLRRTYGWIFLLLLLAWLLKVTSAFLEPAGDRATFIGSVDALLQNAAIASIPGWAVLLAILTFYGWLIYVALRHSIDRGELTHGQVHV
jgi:uncharacterized membrane protein